MVRSGVSSLTTISASASLHQLLVSTSQPSAFMCSSAASTSRPTLIASSQDLHPAKSTSSAGSSYSGSTCFAAIYSAFLSSFVGLRSPKSRVSMSRDLSAGFSAFFFASSASSSSYFFVFWWSFSTTCGVIWPVTCFSFAPEEEEDSFAPEEEEEEVECVFLAEAVEAEAFSVTSLDGFFAPAAAVSAPSRVAIVTRVRFFSPPSPASTPTHAPYVAKMVVRG